MLCKKAILLLMRSMAFDCRSFLSWRLSFPALLWYVKTQARGHGHCNWRYPILEGTR